MNLHANEEQNPGAILQDLMDLYGQDVWNLAFSITRRIDQADDISQEVFIKVYQKLDTFRGEASIRTWILQVTRHTAYDVRRSAFWRRMIPSDRVEREANEPSAETTFLSDWVKEEAWRAVLQLPIKYREVLILHGHYQMSIREIAEVLNLPERTAKTRLYRAREKAFNLYQEGTQNGRKNGLD